MKKILLISLFIMTTAYGLSPQPAPPQKTGVTYHNAIIHQGNGKVLNGATISFNDGKITRVGFFKAAWQKGDIDLKGKHIYPGFILPVTNLGISEVGSIKATRDDRETGQNNANVRSIVAYNTDSEITPTLKFNGILLAQITPLGGLISGLSSIVQLDAWNWEDAAISIDDAVHVNWPSAKRAKFDFATFTMKMVENKNYKNQLNTIQSLFKDAKQAIHKQNGKVNLKLDAVNKVFTKGRKVYIHCTNPKSIIKAVNFFKEISVKNLVLVTSQNVEPIIGFIQKNNIPTIVSSVHDMPGKEDSSVDAGYNIAIKLHKAGVLTALGYQGAMSARNLPFTAGTLVAYGLDKEQALEMITLNTAKILGIDKNYGSLEQGKSATLIITSGDVFDMKSSIIENAYIDGRKLNLRGRQQKLNTRYLKKYHLNKQNKPTLIQLKKS